MNEQELKELALQLHKERQEENEKEWVQSLQPMKINR